MIPVAAANSREELAGRAVDTLRQAAAAGYVNLANFQTDTDLDALRDRQDFRDFLLDLAMPANPFAATR
jgi:hypothetical protein